MKTTVQVQYSVLYSEYRYTGGDYSITRTGTYRTVLVVRVQVQYVPIYLYILVRQNHVKTQKWVDCLFGNPTFMLSRLKHGGICMCVRVIDGRARRVEPEPIAFLALFRSQYNFLQNFDLSMHAYQILYHVEFSLSRQSKSFNDCQPPGSLRNLAVNHSIYCPVPDHHIFITTYRLCCCVWIYCCLVHLEHH